MFFVKIVLDFVTLIKYRSHIEISLAYLNNALKQIQETKELFRDTRISVKNLEKEFNISKIYVLIYYIELIRLYGLAVNMTTGIGETAHKILLKTYYNRINKQFKYKQQILDHNKRRVNI